MGKGTQDPSQEMLSQLCILADDHLHTTYVPGARPNPCNCLWKAQLRTELCSWLQMEGHAVYIAPDAQRSLCHTGITLRHSLLPALHNATCHYIIVPSAAFAVGPIAGSAAWAGCEPPALITLICPGSTLFSSHPPT